MKSVQDTLRRDDQKNARRYIGCDVWKGRDGRTGRALSSFSFISFISSLHSLSSQDMTEAPLFLTLTIPHPGAQRWPSVPTERNRNRGPPRLSTGRFLCSFFFSFPSFPSLFCHSTQWNNNKVMSISIRACIGRCLRSFSLFPFFFPLTQWNNEMSVMFSFHMGFPFFLSCHSTQWNNNKII